MPGEEARALELLHEGVRRWLHTEGWTTLRDVQAAAVAPILAAEGDVLISAGTAAGKTEAAFLPIVSAILSDPQPSVQALYLSPLKALINDQHRRLEEICRHAQVPVHRWHGDVAARSKTAVLDEPRGILQITPESLEALFVLRGSRLKELFAHLGHVVVDELHSFVGTERGRQLQSLLHRLELMLRRRVPRVGLSATLGDLELARDALRPGDPEAVRVLVAEGGGQELRLQVRGYELGGGAAFDDEGTDDEDAPALDEARAAICAHLFGVLRGRNNLVFANSRAEVELFADGLRRLADERGVPNEFFPHHGSLAKELREELETRLKSGELPVSAVCTSTLEMGIDVGDVESVAQIGVPTSVAAVRQRLGRSGRRGRPSVLRVYVTERALVPSAAPQDRLREGLVQAVATCELLLRGWCEPPVLGALHLSTLVHQVLSLIAQHGSVRADEAWKALCKSGPFGEVDAATFADLLRAMGERDLVSQQGDGSLVVGLEGERTVGHYTFYSAFRAAEEYRLVHEGETLGAIPLDFAVAPESLLIFAGRRWQVVSVDEPAHVVVVRPGPGGRPPLYRGGLGDVHEEVRLEMRRLYARRERPAYVDSAAARLLEEARRAYEALDLATRHVVEIERDLLLFFWRGDRVLNTLTALLRSRGLDAGQEGLAVRVSRTDRGRLAAAVQALLDEGPADALELARGVANKELEKFDPYLSDELLARDYASRHLDPDAAHDSLAALAGEL